MKNELLKRSLEFAKNIRETHPEREQFTIELSPATANFIKDCPFPKEDIDTMIEAMLIIAATEIEMNNEN